MMYRIGSDLFRVRKKYTTSLQQVVNFTQLLEILVEPFKT